ncbi:mitochondrial intermediate peptidase isoform X1 [Drosophila eugracilis]|uniref:mitochondrial intermediate peptidase isoform X1 n=1 Tax=Drosophila eugracilis TaxID=29029 RepID=UPI001BD9B4B8|nr:mitochondrial intermediate peptidase isoform X1 [Drosophila eugracilis]
MLQLSRTMLKCRQWQYSRWGSTWTPLAKAFNSPPVRRINITRNDVGLFCLPELRSFEGFFLLRDNVESRTQQLISEALSDNRQRKMVDIFDELSNSLCKVADLAEFVRIAHPQCKYKQAAEQVCISICGVVESLNTNKAIYKSLNEVVKQGDKLTTSDIDRHVARLFLFDFEQCGIHLHEEERLRVVRLNDSILQLGQKFVNGSLLPSVLLRRHVPEAIGKYFPTYGDNVIVSGLCSNAENVNMREAAYRLYLHPSENQEELLRHLLLCRHELARSCGFDTYAHRALKGSTMETPEVVREFIDDLSEKLRPRADADFAQMTQMKRQETGQPEAMVEVWDTPYFTTRLKQQSLEKYTNEFLPYFSLGGCMEGLNNLLQALYGVQLKNTDMEPGESWHNDIYKLSVVHESEGLLGYIYCDFFEREGKPNQDCHFTIQGGKRLPDGSYQLPVVVVMLGLAQKRWSEPTMLSPARVDNLFHEMGHAMHSMLGRTEHQHVTGTRCSTDFAEVPSVLMEYFAGDPRVLRTFARHFQTHQPISEDMLMRLCASKHLFAASETQLQVFYSALDQAYHGVAAHYGGSSTEILRSVQRCYYGLPYVENTAWQQRFTHLVGYGAKYYAYLVSKTIASWIWQTYFIANPFNRQAGEKYRSEILAHGGAVPSRKLVANFLQRSMTPTALADTLINEIDTDEAKIKELIIS